MATLPNDMIRLRWSNGDTTDIWLAANPQCGMSWPPPERIKFWGSVWFVRTHMSRFADHEVPRNVARGAEYVQEVAGADGGVREGTNRTTGGAIGQP